MGSRELTRLLLDTHVWLWSLLEPERLPSALRSALVEDDAQLWLSPVSVWETLTLAERGRLRLEPDPTAWIHQALAAAPIEHAPVTMEVAMATTSVKLPHRDPADRLLVATAKVFDLTLVTADRRLIEARQVPTLAGG
jgi:PIN domain nuclease of toxin-antitoxin system